MEEAIPERMVRDYTAEEKAVVMQGDQETSELRFARLAATHEIDAMRYREAAKQHPEHAPHFDRLIDIGDRAIAGWGRYYHEHHGVDTGFVPEVVVSITVPYDGTEPAYTEHTAHAPSPFRANLPA